MQKSSIVSISMRVAALFLFVVGLASQQHAVVTSFGERATFKTFFVSLFNRVFTREIDSGGAESFDLSENEWKIFKVFQDADSSCSCTASCEDTNARIDMYLTFERRPRLSDNWDGWACKQTLALNEQTCTEAAPEPDSTCRVAIRGDSFSRPHNDCTVTCTVDAII